MSEIEEKVKKILMEQLGIKPEEVRPEAAIAENLGADSLDKVEIVMALEDEFGLQIPDEDAGKTQTVQEIVNYLESKLGPSISPETPKRWHRA